MTEYAITAFAVCCIIGTLGLLSFGSGKAESLSLGIITLFLLATPLAEAVGSFDLSEWLGSISSPDYEIDSGYGAALEEAFADGISLAVAEKFSLNKDDVRVRVSGFDSKNMRAEKIRVILSGRAALADYKAVEGYLDGLSMGECSVEIEIG